jgi:hypothetical protein
MSVVNVRVHSTLYQSSAEHKQRASSLFQALVSSGVDVHSAELLHGFEASAPAGAATAAAAAEPQRASGMVLTLSADTKLASVQHLVRGALGGRVSVYRLQPSESVASTAACQEAFRRQNIAANLHERGVEDHDVYSIEHGDSRAWATELGGNDHFASVVASKAARGRLADLHAVVHSGAAAQSDELVDVLLRRNPQTTLRDVAESVEYARLQNYADRNNRALGARLAELASLNGVHVEDDLEQHATDEYHCPRPLAKPNAMLRYGTLRVNADAANTVTLFQRAFDMASSEGDRVALPLDYLSGVRMYTARESLPSNERRVELLRNKAGDALPVSTGRADAAEPLSEQQENELHQRLFWAGKATQTNVEAVRRRIGSAVDAEQAFPGEKFAEFTGLDARRFVCATLEPLASVVSNQ